MIYNPGQQQEPSNLTANSVGSRYAEEYGHKIGNLIAKVTNRNIFDAAPQQFYDLKLLNMMGSLPAASDEFFYQEVGHQREPIPVSGPAAGVNSPGQQVIPVSSTMQAATQMIVTYDNNQKGTIVAVDETNSTITVAPYVGSSVPAVADGDLLAIEAPVEEDGVDEFANYFRQREIERFNYIQLFSRAIKYGEVELHKMKNAGTTDNFLSMERKNMFRMFRTDISNVFWNGMRGEAITRNGRAKTTMGVVPMMNASGSSRVTVSPSQITNGLERLAIDTEYGPYGATRLFFAPNDMILQVSKAYKDALTRYTPNDMVANLMLNQINIGSTNIVLVPYNRFTDRASFPQLFSRQGVLLDIENIRLRQMWNERSGETPDTRNNGWRKRSYEYWVDYNMGVEFNNPLACGFLEVI